MLTSKKLINHVWTTIQGNGDTFKHSLRCGQCGFIGSVSQSDQICRKTSVDNFLAAGWLRVFKGAPTSPYTEKVPFCADCIARLRSTTDVSEYVHHNTAKAWRENRG